MSIMNRNQPGYGGWQPGEYQEFVRSQQGGGQVGAAGQPATAQGPWQTQIPGGASGTPGSYEDYLRQTQGRYEDVIAQGDYGGWHDFLKSMSVQAQRLLPGAAELSGPQAYAGLAQILGNQGRMAPQAMNQVLAGISRSTQGQQDRARGQAAAGLGQGSGVAQAIQAAIGQGGTNAMAKVRADDANLAEQRRREDLALFYNMVMSPALGVQGMERQSVAAQQGGSFSWEDALGTAMQGAGLMWPGGIGGGGGGGG